jgi:hypothetical protein
LAGDEPRFYTKALAKSGELYKLAKCPGELEYFSTIQCGSFDLHLNMKLGPNRETDKHKRRRWIYYAISLIKIQGQEKKHSCEVNE